MPEVSANGSAGQNRIRFGLFELDTRSRELRKNGHKIRLQFQPFQVLVMLLESPGEVVTREALRSRLWPIDTFVDFDHGLERGDQAASRRAGRFRRESALRRNAGAPRISIHRCGGFTDSDCRGDGTRIERKWPCGDFTQGLLPKCRKRERCRAFRGRSRKRVPPTTADSSDPLSDSVDPSQEFPPTRVRRERFFSATRAAFAVLVDSAFGHQRRMDRRAPA